MKVSDYDSDDEMLFTVVRIGCLSEPEYTEEGKARKIL